MAQQLTRAECEARHRARHDAHVTAAITRLGEGGFDALITGWNAVSRRDRASYADTCNADGHLWAETPIDGLWVCRRCLRYEDTD